MDCVGRNNTFSIFSLSDEVLLEICWYLNSEDLLSLSQSCTKFNYLLCERKLIRNVDFRAVYSLSLGSLKSFLQPQLRCKNINAISLSSCYWLTSSDILWAVQRLINLKSLHVDDTQLTIKHLTQILKTLKMIQSLSWTFFMTRKVDVNDIKVLAKQLPSIKSLNLWVKNFGVPFLSMLLQFCSSLEDLRLSSLVFRATPLCYTNFVENIYFQLPSLKCLVLNLPKGSISGWIAFLPRLLAASPKVETWHILWLDTSADVWNSCVESVAYRNVCGTIPETLFALSRPLSETEISHVLQLENLRYLVCSKFLFSDVNFQFQHSKVSHLVWDCETLPGSFPDTLEHLCVLCNGTRLHNISKVPYQCNPLVNLTKLRAPICMFLAPKADGDKSSSNEELVNRSRSNRKSHLNEQRNANCILNEFFLVAPNLQHLELKCDNVCFGYKPSPGDLKGLAVIGQWTQLQSLFLENISLVDLSFLVEVASKCPKLRRLGLKHVGYLGSFHRTRELTQAIMSLKFLEDFKFEHPVVEKLGDVLEVLSKQANLRRVAIICKRTSTKQNISSYLNIVKDCSQLVFLYACVSSITVMMSKEFQRALKSMHINKPLWAKVEGNMDDSFWEVCPTIHSNEMIINPSLLNVIPPFYV